MKLLRKSNETEHKRCAYGNGIEMYMGIPRKETEKYNEAGKEMLLLRK